MKKYIMRIVLFLFLIIFFVVGIDFINISSEKEEKIILENAIRRVSVQCYATTGQYPPSIKYLEENFGIQIDREKFIVMYRGFASNIMPVITVERI